ncbi:MAG TPA: DNA/RNA nuclease SfsA [Armatimonadota bacterium]
MSYTVGNAPEECGRSGAGTSSRSSTEPTALLPGVGLDLPPLMPATFLERLSRFSAIVELPEGPTKVCVRNSGRLRELLHPGATVWLRHVPGPLRKTAHDIVLAGEPDALVVVDAHLANPLAARWLEARPPWEFARGATSVVREVGYSNSRLDFQLGRPSGPLWVEVKSVSLCQSGTAVFPDAPTSRGVRHLEHLMELAQRGEPSAVLFLILRPDAWRLIPNGDTDPLFASTLRRAAVSGVTLHALRCRVTLERVSILGPVPVELHEGVEG